MQMTEQQQKRRRQLLRWFWSIKKSRHDSDHLAQRYTELEAELYALHFVGHRFRIKNGTELATVKVLAVESLTYAIGEPPCLVASIQGLSPDPSKRFFGTVPLTHLLSTED